MDTSYKDLAFEATFYALQIYCNRTILLTYDVNFPAQFTDMEIYCPLNDHYVDIILCLN